MKIMIKPSEPSGTIVAKASKSSMQRAVAAALLSDGLSVITNASYCEDSLSAMNMASCLGAQVERDANTVRIKGGLNPLCSELDCGESGLGVRLFSAIAALSDKEIIFTGRGSILKRPMTMIEEALALLGAGVSSDRGYLPLRVKGPLKGGEINIDGSFTSQFLSGLLFALPLAGNNSIIRVDSLKSKPYIDLTLKVLESFGIEIENRDYRDFFIEGKQQYRSTSYRIEEDWSGIAFLAVMGAIRGTVGITGISKESVQADRAIIKVLEDAGALPVYTENSIGIACSDLRSFEYDISDCPDLAPPLTSLAAFCKGKSVLRGTNRLAGKESNRALALQEEFGKLGVEIEIKNDRMEIQGIDVIRPAEVDSHDDHRIAMALAICAVRASGPVVIRRAEAVKKSYPDFFDDIASLGISVSKI